MDKRRTRTACFADQKRETLILLNSNEGDFHQSTTRNNLKISEFQEIGEHTVERIKRRLAEEGLEYTLEDKPSEKEYKRKTCGSRGRICNLLLTRFIG